MQVRVGEENGGCECRVWVHRSALLLAGGGAEGSPFPHWKEGRVSQHRGLLGGFIEVAPVKAFSSDLIPCAGV